MTSESIHAAAACSDELAGEIQLSLLAWYRVNKRELPWRGADAYGVWISEVMLQQTQVATVIPYYLRFMARFPTVFDLASGSLDDVLQHWAGLGYYARGRNLHRAAGEIVKNRAGRVPDTIEEILKLPGIGAYTAGAILSIAYDRQLAAIDANVIRVLCRVFGVRGDPKSNATQAEIRRFANRLVPKSGAGDFNQALMELGALLCEPVDPKCERCPLLFCCSAGNSSNPAELPEYAASVGTTNVVHSCAVLRNDNDQLLVLQRPPHGLWGGLWEFPRVVCNPGESPMEAARRAANDIAGIEIEHLDKLTIVKHTVTRYRITLHAFVARFASEKCPYHISYGSNKSDEATRTVEPGGTDMAGGSLKWPAIDALREMAFSSPQTQVLKALLQKEADDDWL